jgi:hypothetical protein
MVMLYDAAFGAGLINQMYSHIAAVMLARAMGAELVLPAAMHRDTFNASCGNMTWHVAPPESLLDVEAVKQYWRGQGMLIHTVRAHWLPARASRRQAVLSTHCRL